MTQVSFSETVFVVKSQCIELIIMFLCDNYKILGWKINKPFFTGVILTSNSRKKLRCE